MLQIAFDHARDQAHDLMAHGRNDEALVVVDEFLKDNENHTEARLVAAKILLDMGSATQAEECLARVYDEAILRFPELTQNIEKRLREGGNRVTPVFQNRKNINPYVPLVSNGSAPLESLVDHDMEILQSLRSNRTYGNDIKAILMYASLRDFENATSGIQMLENEFPGDPDILALSCYVHFESGNIARANEAYDLLVKVNCRPMPERYLELGEKIGRYTDPDIQPPPPENN